MKSQKDRDNLIMERSKINSQLFNYAECPHKCSFCNKKDKDYIRNKTKEMDEIGKPGGKAICFGWNSNGLGKGRGFELLKVLLVAHGGSKNDTIVTVERKGNSSHD